MVENRLLTALKAKQQSFALEALTMPSSKTEFEYGQRCGYLMGLKAAEQLMLELLDEDRGVDNDL